MDSKSLTEFLDDLNREIHYDEHRLRLKEELTAHIEDATYERMVNGVSENNARQESFTQLGTVKEIAHTYNTHMKYRNHLAIASDGLFIGLISSIPYLLLLFGLNTLWMRHYPNHQLLTFLAPLLISSLILIIGYIISGNAIARFIDSRYKKILFFASIILPSTLIILTQIPNLPLFSNPWWLYVSGWSVYVISSGLSVLLLTQNNFRLKLGTLLSGKKTAYRILSYGSLLGGSITIIGGTISTFTVESSWYRSLAAGTVQILSLFVPLSDNYFSPTKIYIVGTVLVITILLCVIGIIRSIKEKTVPVLKILVAAFLISIFFISEPLIKPIDWKVPVHNISDQLVHDQTTLFYPLARLAYSTSPATIVYGIHTDNDGSPIINQDYLREFKLEMGKSVETVYLNEMYSYNPSPTQIVKGTLPARPWFEDKRLHCTDESSQNPKIPYFCTTLTFKDKVIFSQPEHVFIFDANVSNDEKWLVLIQESSAPSKHIVYVVSLQ